MDSHWLNPNLLPTADAYGATPYEASEIDQHVDGARIWATLLQAREEVETKINKAHAYGRYWGYEQATEDRNELFGDYCARLQESIVKLNEEFTKATLQKLQCVVNETDR